MGFFSSLAAAVFDPSKDNVNRFKGAKGEAQAASGMLLFLPSEYRVLNDVLLPTPNGTTQIDHVVVSNFGIFVIESKNISGVISGAATDRDWIVDYGVSRFRILNPLFQNASHIKALIAATGLPERYFHSLVFFWSDNCRFQTAMPENVRQMGLCDYIRGKRRFLLGNADVRTAISSIEARRIPSTKKNVEAHVVNLKQRMTDRGSQWIS